VARLASVDLATTWWAYLLLFLAVTASWAGVPFVGTAALAAAAAASGQGSLSLQAILVVSTIAGEAGGLIGYAIGLRWGRELFQRPGKSQSRRMKILEGGERAYSKWGRLAVFVTPAIVSGTAKMQHGQFVIWNFLASLAWTLSVAFSCYGLSRLATGNHSIRDIVILVIGLVATAMILLRRRRRREAEPGS
jgi:membrane protein DedA with SNARE-associated domain